MSLRDLLYPDLRDSESIGCVDQSSVWLKPTGSTQEFGASKDKRCFFPGQADLGF